MMFTNTDELNSYLADISEQQINGQISSDEWTMLRNRAVQEFLDSIRERYASGIPVQVHNYIRNLVMSESNSTDNLVSKYRSLVHIARETIRATTSEN